MTGLSVLDAAAKESQEAVTDARRLLQLANDRYSGGLVAFLDVITAQQSLLTSERQDVQIHGQQLTLSVSLVKALGGGWDVNTPVNPMAGAKSPAPATGDTMAANPPPLQ